MKSEKALELFRSGLNCSQSVLLPFAVEHGISAEAACRLAAAFGAGMGRLQETCGAATGAFMAIGLAYGFSDPGDNAARARTLSATREFAAAFRADFGTLSCRELLGCDLNTEDGQRLHRESNQREAICAKCVARSVELLEGTIGI